MPYTADRIKSLLDADPHLTDPHAIAEKLIDGSTRAERDEMLADALPDFVRVSISRLRMQANNTGPIRRVRGTGRHASHVHREWRDTALAQRISLSGGKAKTLGDLTLADCITAAEIRRDVAAKNIAVAERFERFAAALKRTNARTVGSLSGVAFEAAYGDRSEVAA